MWNVSEEPPGTMEGGPPETMVHAKEKCEQNKNQLESFKEIMLKNKQSLKKKEEEVQEYARRLSKIKSRAKLSHRNREGTVPSKDSSQSVKSEISVTDVPEETIDDISQAKTPKAKSTLLQKKLAENRKVFEQRSKELTESKRAVEEKVEAIRQQLEEKDTAMLQQDQLLVTPVKPVVVTSDVMSPIQIGNIQEKEKKISELNHKIIELEATILDLRENLKEKDSVIESKTKAVTLMSADLSRKGKTTLDTLEDTKDEMRTMQEHFVLLETSLKNKNESLLEQLQERDNKITEFQEEIERYKQQINEQKLSESASADFSRSTMDTLVETKDAMKAMQENFVLIESSLKAKNDNLLEQLQEYELKLAEANERIFQIESGVGIVKDPSIDDLQFKLDKLEHSNKQLQDEKYELQKSIAEMQDKIVNRSVHGSGAIMEKDNRIAELENLVEELKQSNTLLEEESKAELEKQVAELTQRNEEYSNKITDLEKQVHELEAEKNDIVAKLPDESSTSREQEKVSKLTKELEELNKSMIKIKAQHRSKIKNLQKQLENFKMVSDTNAELVRLGNQVALLEEEKGNLQLSLVDFDELKASAGDWQERIADLESKVSAQTKEIQMHIEAIATLENQKLDLMQELHTAKQEISALEAENAESENLRVTAEMKVVNLEEQLESLSKGQAEKQSSSPDSNHAELIKRIEILTQENTEMYNKLSKLEEKGTSDTGSTESFEAIHESDKNDFLKKIEDLTKRNNKLTLKLSKLQDKDDTHVESGEMSFENICDADRSELLKKINILTQENAELMMKLGRSEEKGSSDTGSTESFERIPEHNESMTKIELLTQENSELVIKLTKLEEQLEYLEASRQNVSASDNDSKLKIESLSQENQNQLEELTKLKNQVSELSEENTNLQQRIEAVIAENSDLVIMHTKLEERVAQLRASAAEDSERVKRETEIERQDHVDALTHERDLLEKEVKELRNTLEQSRDLASQKTEVDSLKSKVESLLKENAEIVEKLAEFENSNEKLKENLNEVSREKEELHMKIDEMMSDESVKERLELIDKLEKLNREKESVAQERHELHGQISTLLLRSNEGLSESRKTDESGFEQKESMILASLEREIEDYKKMINEQSGLIEEMKMKLSNKERELDEKGKLIVEYEASGRRAEDLENELKDMSSTVEEWKYKCSEMEEKIQALEAGKASIEDGFRMLQNEKESLLEETKEKDMASNLLKQELEGTIAKLESKLEQELASISAKENEITSLKEIIENKDHELNVKYTQLQNEMITIDTLQEELNNVKILIQEKDNALSTLSDEIEKLNDAIRSKDEEIYSLRQETTMLYEKQQRSKSLDEYNELLEKLQNKELLLNEMERKMERKMKENDDLLVKIEKLSQQSNDIENQLSLKHQELVELVADREHLEARISQVENNKTEAERRVSELQATLENNAKIADDLQMELRDRYKHLEQLKAKHTEDIEMQNQRLENVIEELNAKIQENEALRGELEEKERLVGQNITEEMKEALEARVADLEKKLADAENKIQAQLEKMKKIAANLKKKTAICQELEARVAELEEKWTTEKDEKEAKNKKIQEVEIAMREKDNKIADLEEKLSQAKDEIVNHVANIEKLTRDLNTSKEKTDLLIQQMTEMEEEIVKLHTNLTSCTTELTTVKEIKESLLSEYESCKQQVSQDNERKQLELDEVKEKARELSVRMQVMEAEYVEQLALIKNLKAENGLLLSKQTQINEKLENVEKESEERRLLIEQLQQQVVNTVTVTTQTTEEDSVEDETKMPGVQHCDHCEQCQTLVQALEAKLQEREAEIENLDNELANSIGNFLQMRESLRFNDLMNQSSLRNRSLEDPSYNDLLFQYNSLTSSNEETKTELNNMLKENKELVEKLESIQSTHAALEERLEQELKESKEKQEKLQSADSLNAELLKKCEEREVELLNAQKEMRSVLERAARFETQLNSHLITFESERQQLLEKENLLLGMKGSLEQEIESLKAEKKSMEKQIQELEKEVETYKARDMEMKDEAMTQRKETSHVELSSDERDNAPQLFDASKIFGTPQVSTTDVLADKEMMRLRDMLEEKEVQCFNLTQEIDHLQVLMTQERTQMSQNYNRCSEELKVSQEHLHAARTELQRLEQLLLEKNQEIESLNVELNNVTSQMLVRQNDTESKAEALTFDNDNQIEELRVELNSTKKILEGLTVEREQQNHLLESYKEQITNLEAELRNSTDAELIQDLENRISVILKERDLLQLQVSDLSRSMEEIKDSNETRRNLQAEIENALRERDEAKELVANLTEALEQSQRTSLDKAVDHTVTQVPIEESVSLEKVTLSKDVEEAAKPIDESTERSTHLDVGSTWDTGSTEKLNVDEESWGWNADDVQLAGEQHLSTTLVPSMEVQLRAKIDDLQDRINDLEAEKEKIIEENKAAQIRSGKMVKKLKEYKVQIESLQQQLKIQKSTSDFCELDSAIEEELKAQITKLEKTLSELKEEQKNTLAEKDSLTKRLNVVLSANERYMEMKERQDMDMEVLRIQNKELNNKIQILDKRLQENITNIEGDQSSLREDQSDTQNQEVHKSPVHGLPHKRSVEGDEDLEAVCKKYKEELDDLKDEMEALATENEQLQHFLEEQKAKMLALESKNTEDENESIQIIEELNKRTTELQRMLSKSKEEYDVLRKQYEQSLMDANDQVSAMRQNSDFLKAETFEKISKLELEINNLRQQLEASNSRVNELQGNLEDTFQEKAKLEEKISTLMITEEKFSSINLSLAEVTDLLNVRIQEVADLKQELQRQYVDRQESEEKLQSNIQTLTQELNEKKQELESLKQTFSDKEKELIQQQSVESVSAIVSQATQELVQKHAIEIEEKDKEIRNLAEKISTLQIALDEYSLEAQSNAMKLDNQQRELELLQQQCTEKELTLESVRSDLISSKDELSLKQLDFARYEEELQKLKEENERYLGQINNLQGSLNESEIASSNIQEYTKRIQHLEREVEVLNLTLQEKESTVQRYDQEFVECKAQLESYSREVEQLRDQLQEVDTLKNALQNKTHQINDLNNTLEVTQKAVEEYKKVLSEKNSLLESTKEMLNEKQMELDKLSTATHDRQQYTSSSTVDGLPLFRMADNETVSLENTIATLKAELEKKDEEIEHLKYILSENTYPDVIRDMQDRINLIYNEKAELESQLGLTTQILKEKDKQIDDLKLHLEMKNQEILSKEDVNLLSRDRRSLQDEQEIVKLQDQLHVKEQEINELKYIIAEHQSRLCLQASMDSQTDTFELREMVERLTADLHGKEQEIQNLKSTIAELEMEVLRLQEFERLSEESKDVIQRLTASKEQIRLEAEEILERRLREKEGEIDEIKEKLYAEHQKILDELRLRDKDIENFRRQLEDASILEKRINEKLHEKEEELLRVNLDLAEKERRLAELSITKDAELHNLKVQIHEKEVRIEELMALSEEEEKQLLELRNCVDARETEINTLKKLLEDKVKEYEMIQHALKKDVPIIDTATSQSSDNTTEGKTEAKESTSQELDLALYMLHQRDVRCEELTHELMQLLEERDTLQLRLSNAIRVNEELRRVGNSDTNTKVEASTSSQSEEPLVEHPSPSKSEGPVEIAKEAIDAPIGENKEALALKLSQLHTVSHAKDVRLRDERELRHTQQMSLLAHKDVLSTLPPEAAARLVNANYTLSRDVQSQSSVLLNWLWGKSTPKVVHM